MIALDTNILVRYLSQDDPVQCGEVDRLMAQLSADAPGYVCREVLVELVWVLERSYAYAREDIARALEGLLSASELQIECAGDVGAVLQLYADKGFGFSDLMIRQASQRAGAQSLVTFDRKAAQLDGVDLLGETRPS